MGSPANRGMIPQSTLERLARLPLDFRDGALSPVDLVAHSGFDPSRHSLSPETFRDHLGNRPDLIDAWLQWSEDKRTSAPTWGFGIHQSGASISYNGEPPIERSFTSALDACAAFIVEEIKSLAGRLPPASR